MEKMMMSSEIEYNCLQKRKRIDSKRKKGFIECEIEYLLKIRSFIVKIRRISFHGTISLSIQKSSPSRFC